jgi:hypothetical protein
MKGTPSRDHGASGPSEDAEGLVINNGRSNEASATTGKTIVYLPSLECADLSAHSSSAQPLARIAALQKC